MHWPPNSTIKQNKRSDMLVRTVQSRQRLTLNMGLEGLIDKQTQFYDLCPGTHKLTEPEIHMSSLVNVCGIQCYT